MELVKNLHSILRWVLLVVAMYTIVQAYIGMKRKAVFGNSDNRNGLIFVSLVDVQVLLGGILYFTSGLGLNNIRMMGGEVMKDGYARFFAVEHALGMLIALVLAHIGRSKSKKSGEAGAQHKAAFIYYLIALLIILASIPWPFRKGFEAMGWI